jgi:hypothetical protein
LKLGDIVPNIIGNNPSNFRLNRLENIQMKRFLAIRALFNLADGAFLTFEKSPTLDDYQTVYEDNSLNLLFLYNVINWWGVFLIPTISSV